VRRGRDLITATYAISVRRSPIPRPRYAGNNLACGNCHLNGAPRKFGIPLFGLFGKFPVYSARLAPRSASRSGSTPFTRHDGRAMASDATQMQAMVAYIKVLSTGRGAGTAPARVGVGAMPELDRAARSRAGQKACTPAPVRFATATKGEGVRRSLRRSISATWCRRSGATTASTTAPHGAADHRCELHPLQHAARHRLF